MNHKEYAFNASEITQLEHLLRITPEDHEINRMGFEHRLEKARARIAGVPVPPIPKMVHLEFRGDPVVDGANGMGVDAHFAGRALTAFSEALEAAASGSAGEEAGRYLISEVTNNFFGFLIELPPDTATDTQTGETYNPALRAVGTVQDLLEASLEEGEREEVEEGTGRAGLADAAHPAATLKVAGFLEILRDSGAQVKIRMDRRRVALRDRSEVERAARRLADAGHRNV